MAFPKQITAASGNTRRPRDLAPCETGAAAAAANAAANGLAERVRSGVSSCWLTVQRGSAFLLLWPSPASKLTSNAEMFYILLSIRSPFVNG